MRRPGALPAAAKKHRLEEFGRICRRTGVPLTRQRKVILEAVLDLGTHPTTDEVHAVVAGRKPGISRATVYRTLESLARMGIITKACHPGAVVRYDGRIEPHHHLVCLRCDEVIDIFDRRLDRLPRPDTSRMGFQVEDLRVQLRGLCKPCRQKERQP